MRYSALSTELTQRLFSPGLLCRLASLMLVSFVLSCSSGPAVPADPLSVSETVYLADLYRLPPAAASSAISGQNQAIEADQLPEPDLAVLGTQVGIAEPSPGALAEGTEFSPDVTVLSRLLIISQLALPEPPLPDFVQPHDPALPEQSAAEENSRTETPSPTGQTIAADKTSGGSVPAPAPTAGAVAAAPAADAAPPSVVAAPTAAAVAAANPERRVSPLVPLAVQPVVETEPSMITVSAYSNQAFTLRFSGAGWTFVGDQDGQAGIQFRTRQFENNEVIFSLAPLQTGEYLLLFRRQNPLNQHMESSLVAVTVKDQAPETDSVPVDPASGAVPGATADTDGAASPVTAGQAEPALKPAGTTVANQAAAATTTTGSSASAMPAVSSVGGTAAAGTAGSAVPLTAAAANTVNTANIANPLNAGNTGTWSDNLASIPTTASPASPTVSVPQPEQEQDVGLPAPTALPPDLLAFARAELNANRVATGLEALNRLASLAGPLTAGQDELLYLYGLAYELDTSFRDIKVSHQYYTRVRDDYPRSRFRRLALERIAWMERHFPGLR